MTNDPLQPEPFPTTAPRPESDAQDVTGVPGSVSRTGDAHQNPSDLAGWPAPADVDRAVAAWAPIQAPRDRIWLHVVLFLATLLTATLVGTDHYTSFLLDFRAHRITLPLTQWIVGGLWYSLTVLAILGCHEMGHYLACRKYGVNASLPYFIPAPLTLIGTFGAFIKIRQPIATKRQLFDIGIAGPLAGFVVALPALIIGIGLSHVARVPPNMEGLELGEPLLFKLVSWAWWGAIPEGYSLNLHPMALAAWFGLLATMLNLFPAGQFDGGHISYAVFGRRSRLITLATMAAAVSLTFVSLSWVVWAMLMAVMLFTFGPNHPPTLDEAIPLDRGRRWLAVLALVILVLCFTPAPIQPLDLIRR